MNEVENLLAIVLRTPSPAKGQVDLPLDKRGEPGKENI